MTIEYQKKQLRRVLLNKRKLMTPDLYQNASTRIIEYLTNISCFKSAQWIHCYVSIQDKKEVNTWGLIKTILRAKKNIAVPTIRNSDNMMDHIKLLNMNNLRVNTWGIMEQPSGILLDPTVFEMIIVPMLGGSRKKQRIGYGKGYYDRFLKTTIGLKIGLVFDCCMIANIPTSIDDVPMDIIITEQGIIY